MRFSSPRAMPNSRLSEPSPTYEAYAADGQWHRFGAQPAPSIRTSSPQIERQPQPSEPVRTDNAPLTEGR
jgi:hypothetical protein